MAADCGKDCDEALAALEAYLDGELPHTDVTEVEAHFAACHPCADRAGFQERLREIVRDRCLQDKAPPALFARIRDELASVSPPPEGA